jgi:hypothetical protein
MFRVVLLVLFICAPALARDNGQYSQASPEIRDWFPVPEDVVIRDSNCHGAPVVWWYADRGETKIRCYAPGGGV